MYNRISILKHNFTDLLRTPVAVKLSNNFAHHTHHNLSPGDWSLLLHFSWQFCSKRSHRRLISQFSIIVGTFSTQCVFESHFCQHVCRHEKSVLHTEQWTMHTPFLDKWRHGHWLWYESLTLYFCCDFLLFLRWVRWSLSPSSSNWCWWWWLPRGWYFLMFWNRRFS